MGGFRGANLSRARLWETIFADLNLSTVLGLDTCIHTGPSIIDYRTLAQSGPLPLAFLRGCGLPDNYIEYIPSLFNLPIQFYSCFISYSTKDEDFADRLYADLQNKGVRCWFAPHDVAGGKKLHEQIDEAIRMYDRLLLVLSDHSIKSPWVETEISKARKREQRENRRMLFPVRLAKVRTADEEDWYIDASGKRVFRAYFLSSGPFSERLASIVENHKAGYVNREGTLVIPYSFDSAGLFSEGLAVVSLGQRYGYIRKDGTYAVDPKYLSATEFSDGAARVIENGPCSYRGYGPCSFEPTALPYSPNQRPSPNLSRCQYSFIDKSGAKLFEAAYPDAKDFAEGLAPVGDGKLWGCVNKSGKLAIPMRYENAEPFSEGLARVLIGKRWGYIDQRGKQIIPAKFASALDFSEGVAVVGDDSTGFWFIDRSGHQAIPRRYTAASSFVMGRSHVRVGHDYYAAKWSYIDHTGRAVFTYSDQSNRKIDKQ